MGEPAVRLAYSPCPNDTYIFAALTHHLVPGAPRAEVALHDIEELNTAALEGRYELTKISYGAIPFLLDRYRLLRAGGALGRGCGPLVVARPGVVLERLRSVAIPGQMTTAYLLLRLLFADLGLPLPEVRPLRFDGIIGAVEQGDVEAGLIIHESRFTYRDHGLVCLVDLGEWWEEVTGHPIPLGGILARRDLPVEECRRVNESIRRSLAHARAHESEIIGYVREHAQEMDEHVMRNHIALYVNEFSDDLGTEGEAAIRVLLERGTKAGWTPAAPADLFA
ncbi:1,4-dihydroxy-6-naphthoate synthase [bacterium]|nr:MAG: 1,4-dihydroxy-6-naphthoate synthase [bacterium]